MSTKITLVIALIIMLASTAGCSLTPASSSTNNNSSDSSSAGNKQLLPLISGKQAKLVLDATADGSTQQLTVGEIMAVTVEGNPSTGYGWFATSSNADVIAQLGDVQNSEPTKSDTPVVGAPSMQILYFEAKAAGTATITMEYKRGWETSVTPEKTLTISVEVK